MASQDNRFTTYHDKTQTFSIMRRLNEQRKLSRFCDVVLKVCGEEIFAHSNILTAASDYFGSFLGCGQDWPRAFSQKAPQIIEIYIDGSEGDGKGYSEAVRKVVEYMYTSKIDLTADILNQVTEIAKIMQMNKLLEFCFTFQKSKVCGEVVTEVLDSVDKACVGTMTDSKSKKPNDDDFLAYEDENDDMADDANDPDFKVSTKIDQFKNKTLKKRGRPRKKPSEVFEEGSNSNVDENLVVVFAEKEVDKVNTNSGNAKQTEGNAEQVDELDKEDKQESPEDCEKQNEKENEGTNLSNVEEKTMQCEESIKIEPKNPRPTRYSRRVRKAKEHPDYISHKSLLKIQVTDTNGSCIQTSASVEETSNLTYLYMCKLCNITFNSLEEYKNHKSSVHDINAPVQPVIRKEFSCTRCDFVTKKQYEFKEHMKTHLHSEHTCSFCDYKAPDQAEFEQHMQKHTGDFPYFCMICDTKFKSKAQQNAHMPKHSVVKPFVCEICNAGFKWKHALKSHMITHSDTKDQLCDICGFSTAHKSMLKAHKLIHSGNTYKCEVLHCNFQATKKQNLKYHMLTHSGEKPHQCEVCGQSFSLVKNMKRHMLMHSSEKPIKCDIEYCLFATTRFDKLKEHKLKQHGTGVPPAKKLRLSDYENLSEGQIIHIAENQILTEPITSGTLQEGRIIATVDNSSIIGHVQYAEIEGSSGIIQYVTTSLE